MVAELMQGLASFYPGLAAVVYKDRCTIRRMTPASAGKGEWTDTPSDIATGIPCAFVPRGTAQKEVVVAGKSKGFADGDVWLQAQLNGSLLDVRETDQIVIAANGTEPARTMEIIFPAPHQGVLIQAAVRFMPSA